MSQTRMTGGEAAIAALASQGVDIVFGIPGGHSLAIYDALAKQPGMRHVLGRHEQGLGFMADGYARSSGKIGVLTTTSGPAVANLACAMGGATTDSSAVLAIASTVRSDLVGKNRGGLHDCGEAIEIMRPVCRHVRRCATVADIPSTIAELIGKLRNGRPGAAHCEIPWDLLRAQEGVVIPGMVAVRRAAPSSQDIASAASLLSAAQRPVIWAGMGAVASGAGPEIERLAQALGAFVVPTVLARGILPCDHPFAVMADGALLTEVNAVVAEADVVLAVGTMFKEEDTAGWAARLGGKLIHIDIDPAEMGRSYPPDVGIVADAATALAEITRSLKRQGPADAAWRARGKRAESDRLAKRRAQSPVEMQVLDILRAAVPKDGILVCDRCNLGYWAFRCMPLFAPRTFQYPMGYGGLGGALPQSFGAKLACPNKPVVCVIGDGGFQFTATELAVGAQESIPVTIVLCNNRAYGAIRANQDRNFGGRRFGCELKNPDFLALAAAYGIPAVRAETPEAFARALAGGIASEKLNLVELTLELCDP